MPAKVRQVKTLGWIGISCGCISVLAAVATVFFNIRYVNQTFHFGFALIGGALFFGWEPGPVSGFALPCDLAGLDIQPIGWESAELNWWDFWRLPHIAWRLSFWIICIPLWMILAVGLLLTLWSLRSAPRRAGNCPKCGYDLRGTPERCPECGVENLGQRTRSSQSGELRSEIRELADGRGKYASTIKADS